MQRFEDSAPELLEFERLKDFFEPFLRSASSNSHGPGTSSHTAHFNPITAAASSALARDVPGVEKYRPPPRGRTKAKHGSKDDLPAYRARVEVGGTSGFGTGGDADIDLLMHLESPGEVVRLDQRLTSSWSESRRTKYRIITLPPFLEMLIIMFAETLSRYAYRYIQGLQNGVLLADIFS